MPNSMTDEVLVDGVQVVPMRLSSRQAQHVYDLMRGTCRADVAIEWKRCETENVGGVFKDVCYQVARTDPAAPERTEPVDFSHLRARRLAGQ